MKEKKTLLNYCGLLGVVSLLSYTAAVVSRRWPTRAITGWLRR